jgi:DNA-binding MarR family transcriptional regulator
MARDTKVNSSGDDVGARTQNLVLGNLANLLGFHLRLAHVAVYRDFTAGLAELDITQRQAATLELIEANPGVSQVDLANTLGADRATMMAMVDRLETRGLLTRRRSTEDRRRQELNLTDPGHTLLSRARTLIGAHEKRFTDRLSPEELEALLNALKRLHQQF